MISSTYKKNMFFYAFVCQSGIAYALLLDKRNKAQTKNSSNRAKEILS